MSPYVSRPSPLTQERKEALSGILEKVREKLGDDALNFLLSTHVEFNVPTFGLRMVLGDRMWTDRRCAELLNILWPFKDTLQKA